ncbi:RNA polymerase sigma factor [Roseimaritima ulvae]|uniref:RNA polymerase sigma factor n=1 Tax=Roseimaritima ulvae TaxID=980254 RepID=A0A5B9QR68_9BACT|nr:sigma-70 family RNA polymerase sigma factor [Roseimaritima ulvae]QEG41597.1 RNA polymerase sigma factor [Roseimaritima ulvae]
MNWADCAVCFRHNVCMTIKNQMLPDKGRFATTRWSVVVSAGQPRSKDARQALATLCESYWYPLYAFARRSGNRHEDASDLVQAFFANLLETNGLQVAQPERGKFRAFLLGTLKNFAAKQWRSASTKKRGGEYRLLSIDYRVAEGRYLCEPQDDLTAEKIFERKWAMTVLHTAMAKLAAEQETAGKTPRFNGLKMYLGGDKTRVPYRELSQSLNMSEGAIKVAIHRLRTRYRELLRDEIADTVADPNDVDDELRSLFAALSR